MDWFGLLIGVAGIAAGLMVLFFRRRVARFFADVFMSWVGGASMADMAEGPMLAVWAAAIIVMGLLFVLTSV